MNADDTIVAISTPPGRGGIGVVRLSGPGSTRLAGEFFRSDSRASFETPNRAVFGHVVDPATGAALDEAVATWFKAPHSYTGEDVVELSCHGSPVILRRLLEMLVARGARPAEPGEFTFRAFFNRRIDLAQAQAVRDVIDAQTDFQARIATRQLEGSLSKSLDPHKQSLIEIVVHLESSVEFVEDDISTEAAASLIARLDLIIRSLEEVASSFAFGRYLRDGFDLAIIGRPNVGKSSVFNRLIGRDRAIVTELPGTTRDALYETTSISGVPVRLIDTAGIRETADVVESIGITRSREALADAEIVLLIIDQSQALTSEDAHLLESVPVRSRIVALNKSDLPRAIEPASLSEATGASSEDHHDAINISALTGAGFDRLTDAILSRLGGEKAPERQDVMLTDARQHAAINRAIEQLASARELMARRDLEEIILMKLRGGLNSLGEITGETLNEDILGEIFSTFCIGK
jgi:tRNA modification GTPase